MLGPMNNPPAGEVKSCGIRSKSHAISPNALQTPRDLQTARNRHDAPGDGTHHLTDAGSGRRFLRFAPQSATHSVIDHSRTRSTSNPASGSDPGTPTGADRSACTRDAARSASLATETPRADRFQRRHPGSPAERSSRRSSSRQQGPYPRRPRLPCPRPRGRPKAPHSFSTTVALIRPPFQAPAAS